MDSIPSRRFSPGLSAEIWRRWSQGQSLTEIGEALGKGAPSVYGVVSREGGIAPKPRCRSARTLSLAEREEISRGLAASLSIRAMARALGRAASTVSREIERHGGRQQYRASVADEAAWERAKRPKPARLARNRALNRVVACKLSLK